MWYARWAGRRSHHVGQRVVGPPSPYGTCSAFRGRISQIDIPAADITHARMSCVKSDAAREILNDGVASSVIFI